MNSKSEFSLKKCLSKDNTDCIKGICALMVLLHHLAQNTSIFKFIPASILNSLGVLSVSVFFFFSGYGLMTKLVTKKTSYVNSFVRHRILPFYADYLVLLVAYLCLALICNKTLTVKLLLKSLFFGGTVIQYGWYLQVILLFYILFYLCCIMFKSTKKVLNAMIFCTALYCVACYLLGFGEWWYESIVTLPLGMFTAVYSEQFIRILKLPKKSFELFILVSALFLIAFNINKIIIDIPSTIRAASYSFTFILTIIMLCGFINVQNEFTRLVGKYSFEVYVLQGFVLSIYHSPLINIKNDYIYLIVSMLSMLILSFLLRKVFSFIQKSLKPRSVTTDTNFQGDCNICSEKTTIH